MSFASARQWSGTNSPWMGYTAPSDESMSSTNSHSSCPLAPGVSFLRLKVWWGRQSSDSWSLNMRVGKR
jgi:hypothetical protein